MKCKLETLCYYAKEKVSINSLDKQNYISTENMLPNKGGITEAASLPSVMQTQEYRKGDVLISNIRPYFKKIWLAEYNGGCSNDVLVLRASEKCDATYLYYLLSSDAFFEYATATAKGTKMPRGDRNAIMQYEVPIVDADIQLHIGGFLKQIDDKIKINKKVNDNLQSQAQAIFKEWFIDQVSPKWERGTFSNLIERTISGDWGKESLSGNNTEMVYCIRGTDIPDVRIGNKGNMPTRFILPKNYSVKQLVNGDIVVEISGGSPTQSTGRTAIISNALLNRYDKGMVCTNFCKALKPLKGYSMFVYYYWQYLYDKGVFFLYENGTTGIKNLDISGFLESEPIVIAPYELIEKFNSVCQAIYDIVYMNGLENEKLVSLRDTLLPKLMSGEIDVSNIQL